ncbi:LuxR C-terminal-related transcriptional regulator [Streptomyces sp. 372A]
MPVKIRTAQELTQLTPAEKRVAEHLVAGASNAEGAQSLGISTTTFTSYTVAIGKKFGITGRRSRPARAHAVLASGQVPAPPAPKRIPKFSERDLRLLRALAENAETYDIARAAEVAPADVYPLIAELVDKAKALNATHLVGLGHAWGLLDISRARSGSTGTNTKTQHPLSPTSCATTPLGGIWPEPRPELRRSLRSTQWAADSSRQGRTTATSSTG